MSSSGSPARSSPMSLLSDFSRSPTPPLSLAFWVGLSIPNPNVPPKRKRGRPPKKRSEVETPSAPRVKAEAKEEDRSTSPEEGTPVGRLRKRKAFPELPSSPIEEAEPKRKRQKRKSDELTVIQYNPDTPNASIEEAEPKRKHQRKEKTTFVPYEANSTRKSGRQTKPTERSKNDVFPTPSPTNPRDSSPDLPVPERRLRRPGKITGRAKTVAEIDAALFGGVYTPNKTLSAQDFLTGRRREKTLVPVTGPSAPFGTRLPRGAPQYIPRPLSAYTLTLTPSNVNLSTHGNNGAATPPSSDPGSKKRGHDDDEEEQEEREPKKTKLTPPSRGGDDDVELLIAPGTVPLVETSDGDILYFAYGTEMAPSYMERKYTGSVFVNCGKLEGYRWVVGVDEKVKVVPADPSDKTDEAVWGATYRLLPSHLLSLTAKSTLSPVLLPIQLFARDSRIGWFGNEKEAQLMRGEEVEATVFVGTDDGEEVRMVDEEGKVAVRMNQGVVECCFRGMDGDFLEGVLRKWVPRPRGAEGVYW